MNKTQAKCVAIVEGLLAKARHERNVNEQFDHGDLRLVMIAHCEARVSAFTEALKALGGQ